MTALRNYPRFLNGFKDFANSVLTGVWAIEYISPCLVLASMLTRLVTRY